jgi:hypothetical protein
MVWAGAETGGKRGACPGRGQFPFHPRTHLTGYRRQELNPVKCGQTRSNAVKRGQMRSNAVKAQRVHHPPKGPRGAHCSKDPKRQSSLERGLIQSVMHASTVNHRFINPRSKRRTQLPGTLSILIPPPVAAARDLQNHHQTVQLTERCIESSTPPPLPAQLPVPELVPFRLTRQLQGLLLPNAPADALQPGLAALLGAMREQRQARGRGGGALRQRRAGMGWVGMGSHGWEPPIPRAPRPTPNLPAPSPPHPKPPTPRCWRR